MRLKKIEPRFKEKNNPRVGLITLATDFNIEKDMSAQLKEQNKSNKDRMNLAKEIANIESTENMRLNGQKVEHLTLQEQINFAEAGMLRIKGEVVDKDYKIHLILGILYRSQVMIFHFPKHQ